MEEQQGDRKSMDLSCKIGPEEGVRGHCINAMVVQCKGMWAVCPFRSRYFRIEAAKLAVKQERILAALYIWHLDA